jgi:hypothetical protein
MRNEKQNPSEGKSNPEAKALAFIEAIWDRQLAKGDDEFYQAFRLTEPRTPLQGQETDRTRKRSKRI